MTATASIRRRTVLAWGGALAAAMTFPTAARADPASASLLSATTAGLTPVLVPGHDQTVKLPRDLGITLRGPLPAGTDFSFTYDPRLYKTNSTALVTLDDKPLGNELYSVSYADGLATLILKQNLPDGALTIIAGHLSPSRYPYDIVRDLSPVLVTEHKKTKPKSAPAINLGQNAQGQKSGEPWGAECGALWDPVAWGNNYRYYRPLSASIRSAGPGPVPAGSSIRICCDAQFVRELDIVKATDSAANHVAGKTKVVQLAGVSAIEWTLERDLAAGSQILLTVSSVIQVGEPDPVSVKHPTIDFLADINAFHTQRTTYRESIHRGDIVASPAGLADEKFYIGEGS